MLCVSFASLSLLAVLLSPQAVEPEPNSFVLKTKEAITADAVAIEGDRAVLHVTFMGGSATVRRKLTDFTPDSQLRIREQVAPPTTFAHHFELARTAVELGILAQAGDHAGRARALSADDASGAQRKELDHWAGATLLGLFRGAIQRGEVVDARHFLKLMATRVPDEFSEEQMSAMFDELAKVDLQHRTVVRSLVVAKEAAARRTDFDQAMVPVLRHVAQADELVKQGLRTARSTSQSTHAYEQAVAAYQLAGRDLQKLLAKTTDADDQEEAATLVQRIKDGAVDAALHAGNTAVVQGDYRTALEWASKCLLIDPANAEAKALIRTVQYAQTSGNGWGGWGRW